MAGVDLAGDCAALAFSQVPCVATARRGAENVVAEGSKELAVLLMVFRQVRAFAWVVVQIVEAQRLEGAVLHEFPPAAADGVILLAAVGAALASHPDHRTFRVDASLTEEHR